MIDWIEDHQGFMAVLLTMALVVVTVVYAYLTKRIADRNAELVRATVDLGVATDRMARQTERMAQASDEALLLQVAPNLSINPAGASYSNRIWRGGARLRNTGSGAAIDVRIRLFVRNPDEENEREAEFTGIPEIRVAAIGSQETIKTANWNVGDKDAHDLINNRLLPVYIATYQDALGNQFETRQGVNLAPRTTLIRPGREGDRS